MDWRVASIGTLSLHPLWNERGEPRTGHATTTIIKSDDAILLVDPSLPPQMLDARLQERWGMRLTEVTHVFLTSFDPDRRRSLLGVEHASWLMHEPEIQAAAASIQEEIHHAENDPAVVDILKKHLDLLADFTSPEDQLFSFVDLFPLPGFTPGSCGLLLPLPKKTVLITGDTVATREHLEKGAVLQNCAEIETAKESFLECLEIADIIIPGRDNVVFNPARLQ
ncbi:MAG: MBL fold metallo-hydrolase [Phycisphaerales bacterium]|jgi:glyoxylase-like metal-dependent hydrolase (beta-lactamase superfamily II)|nr:MBL fold metallo-hydrolase [Phycisphaerales bacterium]